MPDIDKHTIKSNNHRAFEKEVTQLFRKIELDQIEDSTNFDLAGEIISVQNIHIWRTLSQSGYTIRYGSPMGQDFQLHFIEAGRYKFRSGRTEIDAPANSAVLLKDTSKIEMTASPGSAKLAVLVPLSRFLQVFDSAHGTPGQRLANFQPHVDPGVEGIDPIREIARLLAGDQGKMHPFTHAPNGALLLGDALIATFAGLWPKIDNSVADGKNLPRHLQRAIAWLDTHAGEDVPIGELARQSGASIRTLQNSFRQHLSTSPNAYIQSVRLSRVRHELLHGDRGMTIEQIAARWGFGHMGYFAARYRSTYGEPPSLTRQKWKNSQS